MFAPLEWRPRESRTYGEARVAPSSRPDDGSARRVFEPRKRPVALEPLRDGAVKGRVELGAVGPHPGAHAGDVGRPVERVDVDAADDLSVARLADGVGEAAPVGEVARVALQI